MTNGRATQNKLVFPSESWTTTTTVSPMVTMVDLTMGRDVTRRESEEIRTHEQARAKAAVVHNA